MEKEKIKGIIYDLDGVVLDSEYYHWQGWVVALKEYGIELSKETYLKYAGKREDIIDGEMIKDFNLNIEPGGHLLQRKKEVTKEFNIKNKIAPMNYARESLDFFTNDKRFKVALCAGGFKEETLIKLENNDFLKYFPIIVAGSEVKRGKPNPDIYLLAVERLGLKPEECLAFEDTQYGLAAAKAAGVYCFAVPNEYSAQQDFSKADKVISSLKEAVDFFRN